MLAAKSPAEFAELKKLGLDKPVAYDLLLRKPRLHGNDEDFHDAADDAVDLRHPVAELNHVADAPKILGEEDLALVTEAFGQALAWAGEAKSLVDMGWRFHTMLNLFSPALLEGIELEVNLELRKSLAEAIEVNRNVMERIGAHYRSVLAWVRRCSSLSAMGQRGFAAIYVIKRAAIGGRTNASLGGLSNKTRQAVNKLVGDFRDNCRGYRNEVMRSDETRIKCRMAQIFGS